MTASVQTPAICAIEGCEGRSHRRGWCVAHYRRWQRHGDPNALVRGRAKNGEPARWLVEVALKYVGRDCLIWPFARNDAGYGNISINGKNFIVSRLVCESVHGPAPTPDHQAAHSCAHGHFGCVTRSHLSWKLPVGNAADRTGHGNSAKRLTEHQASEILKLKGRLSEREIASRYSVSRQAVNGIHSGKLWSHLTDGGSR